MKSGPIRHAMNVLTNAVRESAKRGNKLAQAISGEPPRSPKWRAVEKHFLAVYPTCSACAGTKRLNVHHVKPFHLEPTLELATGDPVPPECNLITLCMGPNECHLKIGHGGDFKAWNPRVRQDALVVLNDDTRRDAVEAAAKATRQYAPPKLQRVAP